MKIQFSAFLLIYFTADFNYAVSKKSKDENRQCTIDNKSNCGLVLKPDNENQLHRKIYSKEYNLIVQNIENALSNYKPCSAKPEDKECACHASVIANDLAPFQKDGISRAQIDAAAKYGTRYKILQHKLYREEKCMFPARCGGIEHFLQPLLPQLKDMDLVINTRDWPQINAGSSSLSVPVFSFSKTADYRDIMYPAWSFWAGGPAISLHPTGIGRWDLLSYTITRAADEVPWAQKKSIGFFRGSRTSDERDSLILLSRRLPLLVDAMYTQNQAWKSPKDTLNAVPAAEVSFEQHCRYKYLFNFRGVAASFRLKHLFLCKSLVFHVGDAWQEFFYASLKPWVHYVPLSRYPSEDELELILRFFGEHDQLAEQIAQRGYEFIWQHLRMSDVQCYWQKLLSSYQQLMRYQVKTEDDMNELLDH